MPYTLAQLRNANVWKNLKNLQFSNFEIFRSNNISKFNICHIKVPNLVKQSMYTSSC